MKLPNSHLAIIEREKICEYLLNAAHPDNGGKALFFFVLGFSRAEWRTLQHALRKVAQENEVGVSMESSHQVCCRRKIEYAIGKESYGAVWIVDKGSENPRLVTPTPLRRSDNDQGT